MTTGWSEFAASAIYPSPSAIKADNDLRVASLTIAAYEYVVGCRSGPLVGTHIRLVISSPSLQNTGYISPLITEGERLQIMQRVSNNFTLVTDSSGLVLFVLIRQVFSHC